MEFSVDILAPLLKLSDTGDTAKYLVFRLSRVCALSPINPISPNYPPRNGDDKEKEKIETRLFQKFGHHLMPA
jgi:hypothetical protein